MRMFCFSSDPCNKLYSKAVSITFDLHVVSRSPDLPHESRVSREMLNQRSRFIAIPAQTKTSFFPTNSKTFFAKKESADAVNQCNMQLAEMDMRIAFS